jgi:hypothetical protein
MHTESEVDFGLWVGSEVIEGSLLPGQLAKQSREDRSDQRGLAGPVLAYNGDQPLAQSGEVNADFIWKRLSNSPQPQVM